MKKPSIGEAIIGVAILVVLTAIGVTYVRSEKAPAVASEQPVVATMTLTRVEPVEGGYEIRLLSESHISYSASSQFSQYVDPILGPQTTNVTTVLPKVGAHVSIRKYAVLPYPGLTGPEYSSRFTGFAVTGVVGGREVTSLYSVSPSIE